VTAVATPPAGSPCPAPGADSVPGVPLASDPMLRALWLGRVAYEPALALQEGIAREHARFGDTLLLLEHDPVYTTGRGGKPENLLAARAPGEALPAPLVRIGRGGDVTWHGPGQLVGYALVDLRARGGDVHRFLRDLESGVISTLGALGVVATRWPGKTGVWVSDRDVDPRDLHDDDMHAGRVRKIASIGIGVRRGVSLHGFALNVSPDLGAFAAIVPCGLGGVRMTSVACETDSAPPPLEHVAALAARAFGAALAPHGDGR